MSVFSREMLSFIEITRRGSIRAAADVLNVSSSALSRQVQMLEKALGARLLVRTAHGVNVTSAGQQLLDQAATWIEGEQRLRENVAQNAKPMVRLGVMECLLPFIAAHPAQEMSLKVMTGDTASLTDRLIAREFDAIIAFNVVKHPELRIHITRDYPIGLVAAHGVLPTAAPLGGWITACHDIQLCLLDDSLSMWPRLNAEFTRLRIAPRISLHTNSVALLLAHLRHGAGAGFLTMLDCGHDVQEGLLDYHNLSNIRLSESLDLCTRDETTISSVGSGYVIDLFNSLPLSHSKR
ncbi:hypothetical protein KSAC_32090 (plasmid) [Komagataeibacter saccharivorans]|uniref:LysR family transcriptional regulator n=1 Tax=Komagataeibacter saccharivorans TaxID=265959 RepID=UPI0010C497F5|nr:LysR family transcriptional regulator [Komagataeibacter saccharivorans]QBL95388.1 hypothetical protein KSAC_32090 [Komagataeibacter saccharivorans]